MPRIVLRDINETIVATFDHSYDLCKWTEQRGLDWPTFGANWIIVHGYDAELRQHVTYSSDYK